jgi:hypothetical protein
VKYKLGKPINLRGEQQRKLLLVLGSCISDRFDLIFEDKMFVAMVDPLYNSLSISLSNRLWSECFKASQKSRKIE